MKAENLMRELHPLEVRVLRWFEADEVFGVGDTEERLSFNEGQGRQAISWLSAREFLTEKGRSSHILIELTELGRSYQEDGTPEERLLDLVKEEGPLPMPVACEKLGLENRDVGSAFGQLSRDGVLAMDEEKRVTSGNLSEKALARVSAFRSLLDRLEREGKVGQDELSGAESDLVSSNSKKRGASKGVFRVSEREDISYTLSSSGVKIRERLEKEGITGEEIGALTPELLQSGGWRDKTFRAYGLNTPPVRVLLGRKNPYVEFLEDLKDKLVSLGFEEFDGPLLETEFWNSDALFMPQFHAARDIHDVFSIKDPTHAREIPQPWLDNVASAHENGGGTGSRGWQYSFDRNFTRRMILRSQGTVLSAKTLPVAKIPGKYFGVLRCFRPDTVDATHAADFHQTEGIVLGEEVNLKTLLGLLKMFAVEVAGAEEFRYVPGYFPFTEPSVEIMIKHPTVGWMELGGSGIFRPEVTEPLGVHVPVLAWGLGIDRMAMMSMGIEDMRNLFSDDIERVRMRIRR